MQYSTAKIERELNAGGMEFEKGSVYDRFCQLTDLRGVNGKRYELGTILTIVVFAKLCGEDKPMGIAEWAKHRKDELVKFFGLNWSRMPHHNTIGGLWRITFMSRKWPAWWGNITRKVSMVRCMRWMGKLGAVCARRKRKGRNMA